MRVAGIHHVQVAVPPGSERAARAFYGGVLGLEEIPKPPHLAARGGVWFRCGGLELHLGVEEPFRPAHKAHVAVPGHRDRRLASALGGRWYSGLGRRALAGLPPVLRGGPLREPN